MAMQKLIFKPTNHFIIEPNAFDIKTSEHEFEYHHEPWNSINILA